MKVTQGKFEDLIFAEVKWFNYGKNFICYSKNGMKPNTADQLILKALEDGCQSKIFLLIYGEEISLKQLKPTLVDWKV